MQTARSYTRQQLVNSMKMIFKLLEYELKNNDSSRKYLNDLTNSKFPEYDQLFQEQYFDNMGAGEDYIGKKNIYNHVALKAIDEYRYNNDKLILFRNFLLLLVFMRSLHLPDIKKNTLSIKSTIFTPSEYDSPLKLFKAIFTLTGNEKKYKKDETYFNQNVDIAFVDMISTIFEGSIKDINFSLTIALDRTVNVIANNTSTKTNITQFINSFCKLLTRNNETIIELFFEIYKKEYGHLNIPDYIISFMRHYTFKGPADASVKSQSRNYYISGVGAGDLLAKLIADINYIPNINLDNVKLTLASDDSNEILRQISGAYNYSLTNKTYLHDKVNNDPLLEFTVPKYDVVLSIIPEKLDFFTEQMAIKKYPDYPIKQISFYAYYEKIIHSTKNKALIIVPITLICTNSYSEKKFLKDIDLMNSGNEITRDPEKIKSTQYQEFLHNYQMNKIIKEQKIKKIMLLPKDIFHHTSMQCVLIELTDQISNGIQFINIPIVDYYIKKSKRATIGRIFNHIRLYKHYGETVFINPDTGGIIDETTKNSIPASIYIPYPDLITSNNLLPEFHFKNISKSTDTRLTKIDDFFEVIKLQRNVYTRSNIKADKGRVRVSLNYKQFSKSEFSPYGITFNDDIKKTGRINIPEEDYKFPKLDMVINNDILVYVHYVDTTDMTLVQFKDRIDRPELSIRNGLGTHNLIIIRFKGSLDKQDAYAKALFLWLMSNEGQKSLQSITKTTSSNRPLISTEDLKMLQVDLSGLDNAKESFRKLEDEIKTIKKSIKSIKDLIG